MRQGRRKKTPFHIVLNSVERVTEVFAVVVIAASVFGLLPENSLPWALCLAVAGIIGARFAQGPYVRASDALFLPKPWDPSVETRLVLEDGSSFDDPDPKTLEQALRDSPKDEDWFAVLSRGEGTFMQTHARVEGTFNLYYQQGSVEKHYQAKEVLSLEQLIRAFRSYAEGSNRWKTQYRWEKFSF